MGTKEAEQWLIKAVVEGRSGPHLPCTALLALSISSDGSWVLAWSGALCQGGFVVVGVVVVVEDLTSAQRYRFNCVLYVGRKCLRRPLKVC